MDKIVEKAERLNSLIALTCKTLSQLFYKNIKIPIESYLENFLNNLYLILNNILSSRLAFT